ncbi:MAG: hypothetical protein U0840_28275 [Gemmataceae bacterium]
MGFFSGRVSYLRFKVEGDSPGIFGEEHLERLSNFRIGTQRVASADGVEVGWTAGEHLLDTRFDLAKNIINDTMQFALRIDANKLPADLLRAYTAIELQALASKNPSGLPSAKQKREAREAARQRLEEEAKDGRFLRRKVVPVLWDAISNELLLGSSSVTIIDRLLVLFQNTFGVGFETLTAGTLAYRLAESRSQTRGVDDASPSPFVPGQSASEVAWMLDEHSRDFLGNEFLLWLWFYLENEDDTVKLQDGSEATIMLASNLVLECPRAVTGRETITHEAPTRLPEAKRAIQAGKLPRKVGLIVVRHDAQYELTLTAETMAVTGARMPAPEESEDRARLDERVTQLRHLVETLDLIYDVFGSRRASDDWSRELARMQKWLSREDRNGGRISATA